MAGSGGPAPFDTPDSLLIITDLHALFTLQADGHNNLGNVLRLAGRPAAALAEYEAAAAANPALAGEHLHLVYT